MGAVVHTETNCEIPFSRREVWPILRKTDWINRALGLPPVHYEIEALREGGSAITASAKFLGLELKWKEIPFEWLEEEFYCVQRIFESGLLSEGKMGIELSAPAEGKTRVRIFSDLVPRNALGAWFIRGVLGPKTNRGMERIMDHVTEHLRGHKPVSIPKLPRTPVAEASLESGLQKLRRMTPQVELAAKLGEMLRSAPDVELSHIRPFAVARTWKEDRWQVLRLFLQATRCGLLDFSWEVLCPNCRSTREPRATSLGQVRQSSHCDVCQIKFDAEFDKSVELKFSVNPNIRAIGSQTFCLAGPGGKPHVFSQALVQGGKSRDWKLPNVDRPFRLRSPQIKNPLIFNSGGVSNSNSSLVIHCYSENFEIRTEAKQEPNRSVHFINTNPFTVQLVFEEIAWDDDILTAAQVTNWQEFRDLFDSEVISPNEQITVGSQIVLFTDLRGSTAMYNGIGDAPAYVVVRDHFSILIEAIREHHGAIVKTIGDAVMAVFSRVDDALISVQKMHQRLQAAIPTAKLPAPLYLKSSLHIGPCLAVNANDKLDYFGTTINLAARMVDRCQGNDLTISEEFFAQPETIGFLNKTGKSAEPSEVKFRGFDHSHKIWRISMEHNS